MEATRLAKAKSVDTKLEVVMIGVSDVDRAKAFYEKLGCRLDADFAAGDEFRVVQLTPHNSEASIIFGKGVKSGKPGATQGLVLAVRDVVAARADLIARGVNVSEVFHYAGGPFNDAAKNPRVRGPDAERRSYYSFASFEDPDGNGWFLQEIQTRLPGRGLGLDVATLTELFVETENRHGEYEPHAPKHHWSGWYAAYVLAREHGKTSDEAARDATMHIEGART